MELKKGYKQTEVGVIPEEWDAPTLGELFTFKNGLNKAKEFFGFGTPIVNYMDVYGRRGIFVRELQGRVSLNKQELKNFEVRKGDVFFTRTSETAEEVGIASVMLDEPTDTVFSGFVLRARPKDDTLDNLFKKYCFSASYVRKQITSKSTETTRALTNGRHLSVVAIARPDKDEQHAIAAALGTVDGLIDGLQQLIAKKRDLKQAAMQQLLTGQARLPGFTGKWESVNAGDVGHFRGGNGFPTRFQGETTNDYPFYKVSDMNNEGNDTFMVDSNNWISEGIRKQLGATAFPAGSIIFAKVGAAVFLERKKILTKPSCIDNNLAALVLDKSCADVRFIHYSLLNIKFGAFVSTTALPSLSRKVLSQITFALPPLPEQTAIAEVLSDMDAEISALVQRREKTRALKQGMMQELLSGKTRLI